MAEPWKFYTFRADCCEFADGFCIAKCINSSENNFDGVYLKKKDESYESIIFTETKEVSKFSLDNIVSIVISLTKISDSDYIVDRNEIEDILYNVNK